MLHGNMINVKSCIRPLMFVSGALFLIFTIISNLFEDSSNPEYTNVMQVLLEEEKAPINTDGAELTLTSSPNIQTISQPEPLDTPSVELSKQPMQVGYAQVEYALRLVKLDSFGQLILNANTEASLNRAIARLPADLPEEQIAHIRELIKSSLPGESGAQVADVFTKYYRYKVTEKALLVNSPRPYSLESAVEQLSTMTDLSYEIMGAEYAEKLLGAQQSRAGYHLESELIKRDNSVSIEERNKKLAQLKAEAENNGMIFSSPSEEVQQLNAEVERMRAAGEDETQIQARREQTLGKGAADQLSLMEAQQNDWQVRYQSFEQEKNLLLASALDDHELQQQMDSLFLLHYSVEELPGARAYDKQFTH